MKIVSDLIKIPKIHEVSTEYIESELNAHGLDVVRWAIVEVEDDYFNVCVSHVII